PPRRLDAALAPAPEPSTSVMEPDNCDASRTSTLACAVHAGAANLMTPIAAMMPTAVHAASASQPRTSAWTTSASESESLSRIKWLSRGYHLVSVMMMDASTLTPVMTVRISRLYHGRRATVSSSPL